MDGLHATVITFFMLVLFLVVLVSLFTKNPPIPRSPSPRTIPRSPSPRLIQQADSSCHPDAAQSEHRIPTLR